MNAKNKACGTFKKLYTPKYSIKEETSTKELMQESGNNSLENKKIPAIKIKEKTIGIMKDVLCASKLEIIDILAPIIWLAG